MRKLITGLEPIAKAWDFLTPGDAAMDMLDEARGIIDDVADGMKLSFDNVDLAESLGLRDLYDRLTGYQGGRTDMETGLGTRTIPARSGAPPGGPGAWGSVPTTEEQEEVADVITDAITDTSGGETVTPEDLLGLWAKMFEVGDLSPERYLALVKNYYEVMVDEHGKYSDEAMAALRVRKKLEESIAKERILNLRKEMSAQKAAYERGEISMTQYFNFLKSQQASLMGSSEEVAEGIETIVSSLLEASDFETAREIVMLAHTVAIASAKNLDSLEDQTEAIEDANNDLSDTLEEIDDSEAAYSKKATEDADRIVKAQEAAAEKIANAIRSAGKAGDDAISRLIEGSQYGIEYGERIAAAQLERDSLLGGARRTLTGTALTNQVAQITAFYNQRVSDIRNEIIGRGDLVDKDLFVVLKSDDKPDRRLRAERGPVNARPRGAC